MTAHELELSDTITITHDTPETYKIIRKSDKAFMRSHIYSEGGE